MSCYQPIAIDVKDRWERQKKALVPCGYCIKCRKRYRRDWIFRLQQEAKDHVFIDMVTLTYDNDNIPWLNLKTGEIGQSVPEMDSDAYFPVLHRRDLTLFLKRLRKRQADYIQREYGIKKEDQNNEHHIRYYGCGEYGTHTFRPHYHVIIFNMLPEIKDRLTDIWQKGFVHGGTVWSDSAISYCTKYLLKGKVQKEKDDFPVKEFITMSRNPGIGHRFLNHGAKFNIKQGKHEHASIMVKNNSNKWQLMPRYYREKILPNGEYLDQAVKHLLQEADLSKKNEISRIESTGQDYGQYELDVLKDEIRRSKQLLKSNIF
jgi:hypothetical protein